MASRLELIEDLQRVANKIGETPKASQYNELGEWNVGDCQNEFDTWNNALRAASLSINQNRATQNTEGDLISDIQRVGELVEGPPTRADVDKHGQWCAETYRKRLGVEWKGVLRKAGFGANWEIKDTREMDCEICGETIVLKEYEADRRFCSRECHGKWRQGRFTGKDSWSYNAKIVECENCGAELERTPWFLEHNDKHFCDQECQGEWLSENNTGENHPRWKGGYSPYYGEGWNQEKKTKVRKRDGFRCQACGKTQDEELEDIDRKLVVHHIKRANDIEDGEKRNSIDNLITLCQSCHMKWEGVPVVPQLILE